MATIFLFLGETAVNYYPHANSHHPYALEKEQVTANMGEMTLLMYHPASPRPTVSSVHPPLSASYSSSQAYSHIPHQ